MEEYQGEKGKMVEMVAESIVGHLNDMISNTFTNTVWFNDFFYLPV
jgi:hypothetical protein